MGISLTVMPAISTTHAQELTHGGVTTLHKHDLSEDTSPSLGGDLNLNGYDLIGYNIDQDITDAINATASDRDYVAEQAAFVGAIAAIVGIGIDSDGNLSAEINTSSNVSSMAINASGELTVTYS